MKTKWMKLGLLVALMILPALRTLALDGAVVIVNPSVTVDNLSASALKDILTGKTKYWDGGQTVVIGVLPDKTDAALSQACGMDYSAFKTYWQRIAFSGRGQEPKRANDVAGLVDIVAKTKGAIAIVPADAALDGVKKIEIK